jgi:chaperone modulatory protein CbpM
MNTSAFLVATRIRADALQTWVESGWLAPQRAGDDFDFSEIDLARARLIRDLQTMGMNEEAVPVILDLIDQLHGLRRAVRVLMQELTPASGKGN